MYGLLCLPYIDTSPLFSSSTALAFLTCVSEKIKSASPRVIQVRNWRKTISIEEKLHLTI
jgi:hypothetical protein